MQFKFFMDFILVILSLCIYIIDGTLIEEMTATRDDYRKKYNEIRKKLVNQVEKGGVVTDEENKLLHEYKAKARSYSIQVEQIKSCNIILKASNSNQINKRIQYLQSGKSLNGQELLKTSVIWTEIINIEGAFQAGILSFRVISYKDSGKWMNEAFNKANIKYGITDSSSSSSSSNNKNNIECKSSILLAATNGIAIDKQHAGISNALVDSYSKVHLSISLTSSSLYGEGECLLLRSEGYVQIVCPISSVAICSVLQGEEKGKEIYNTSKIKMVLSEYLRESLRGSKADFLSFEVRPNSHRNFEESVFDDIHSRYAVVAHLGTRSRSTVLAVENWLRYHLSKSYTIFLFDRYGWHRETVRRASKPYLQTARPVPPEILKEHKRERKELEAIRTKANEKAKREGSASWASIVPINDEKAYFDRRSRRSQHQLLYYRVPPPRSSNPIENVKMTNRIQPFIYYNHTPFENIRRTSDSRRGLLLGPYFDKPMTFQYAVHEYSSVMNRIILLDVDEYLDCSNHLHDVLTQKYVISDQSIAQLYSSVDELRVPRRVPSSILDINTCKQINQGEEIANERDPHPISKKYEDKIKDEDNNYISDPYDHVGQRNVACTYPDLFGLKYKWQKFNKVCVRPSDVVDVSIHGSETPGFQQMNYPLTYVTSKNMPAWDCSIEHLNPNYYRKGVKTRSVEKGYEPYRGSRWWGLENGTEGVFNNRKTRNIYPPLAQMHAYADVWTKGNGKGKINIDVQHGYSASNGYKLADVTALWKETFYTLRNDELNKNSPLRHKIN